MNKQRKALELAEKAMEELDDADLEDAIKTFPKCRVAGEDQDNATEQILDLLKTARQHCLRPTEMGDAVLEELEDLVRDKIKKTPIRK